MGCHNNNQFAGVSDYSGDGCIKDVVRRILDAQKRAVESEVDMCGTSCERSIEDLLSPERESRPRRRHTTIPFMLTCKNTCRPFVGTGVTRRHHGRNFKCIESPIFKVRGFSRGANNCAKLELLLPVYKDAGGEGSHHHHHDSKGCCGSSVCQYFDNKEIRNFKETGICITVDLDAFSGITCLDPVTPIRLHH